MKLYDNRDLVELLLCANELEVVVEAVTEYQQAINCRIKEHVKSMNYVNYKNEKYDTLIKQSVLIDGVVYKLNEKLNEIKEK